MKKLLLIFTIAFLLGCIGQSNNLPKDNISFEEKYNELKSTEFQYNLSNINDLDSFGNYLTNFKLELADKTGENVSAILKLADFRIALLNAQKNILLAGDELEKEINCNETQKATFVIETLKTATENINITISTLNDFKTSFSKYVEKTNINENTTKSLDLLFNQTKDTMQQFQLELNTTCK